MADDSVRLADLLPLIYSGEFDAAFAQSLAESETQTVLVPELVLDACPDCGARLPEPVRVPLL